MYCEMASKGLVYNYILTFAKRHVRFVKEILNIHFIVNFFFSRFFRFNKFTGKALENLGVGNTNGIARGLIKLSEIV